MPPTSWHLPDLVEETKEQRKRFKTYEIGYVQIDSCELRHADGKLVMFLAIDRVSKFTYVEFPDSAGQDGRIGLS